MTDEYTDNTDAPDGFADEGGYDEGGYEPATPPDLSDALGQIAEIRDNQFGGGDEGGYDPEEPYVAEEGSTRRSTRLFVSALNPS